MSSIVAFYREQVPDARGRWLREIWNWNDVQLEASHNYIQILFPTNEASMFNYWAPLVDDETIQAFRDDARLRRQLGVSHDLMLRFYGLCYNHLTQEVTRAANFAVRARNWLTSYNHNHLRITRILKCLRLLGLEGRARAFYECLRSIYRQWSDVIGEETFDYWTEAVEGLQESTRSEHALQLLPEVFAVCRLPADEPFPAWATMSGVLSITRTREELSIVCEQSRVPADVRSQRDWRCLRVVGPLPFSAVGVLACVLVPLAEAGVSVLSLSTFDTDYLLVGQASLSTALLALADSGHEVSEELG